MAIVGLDSLISALGGTLSVPFYLSSVGSNVAGGYTSNWKKVGTYPIQGATPTTAETCTNSTVGAIRLPTVTTEKLYIAKVDVVASVLSDWILVDRLAHMGGLSGTTYLTAQNVNVDLSTASSAGRCMSDGSDVEWFLEWYSSTGSTGVTWTTTYLDQTNTSRTITQATGSIPASTAASRMIPIFPNPSQTIKAVTSVRLSASTGTAGSFGVTAVKRLCGLTTSIIYAGVILDFGGTGLPEIKSTSCLMFIQKATNATVGTCTGSIQIIKG